MTRVDEQEGFAGKGDGCGHQVEKVKKEKQERKDEKGKSEKED